MNAMHRIGGVIVLLGSLVVSATGSARPGRHETIAAARRAPLGTTVTVSGTVTVPTGAFDTGIAIQQGDAGIYVADSLGENYAIGTQVKVTGVLVDSSGLLAIQPSSVEATGGGERIEPECRPTGAVGERTEGRLLRLRGVMRGPLVDDSPYGFKLDIDDGSGPVQVFLYPGAGVSNAGLVDGARLSVVCFSNQYETTYECDPPAAGDLEVLD
jgi:hypothetical protein